MYEYGKGYRALPWTLPLHHHPPRSSDSVRMQQIQQRRVCRAERMCRAREQEELQHVDASAHARTGHIILYVIKISKKKNIYIYIKLY